ncbi:M48 family metalloprotease [Verrucosispora sp. WMMA2044]|uniref:M48 family metalloprotease n=1 Tax=Verrucosispora sp. WMMA2044 TaxID=3016419 RepID=UPI00248BA423|nr:M48 family metalloprotease [Verrucosispora sp. WMMA2044]WBB51130.1 M48 family metalloprotease [Verrucosispora sp. WMMA2044]
MPIARDRIPSDPRVGSCPNCSSTELQTVVDQPPWCGRCEWNLDVAASGAAGRLGRSIERLDRRAGFRADRRLARMATQEDVSHSRLTPAFLLLGLVSGVLVLIPVGALAAAGWLLVDGEGPLILPLLLAAVAYALRPRLGSVRQVVRGAYRLTAQRQVALHRLVERVGDAVDAPKPDVIVLNNDWNAGAAVVGVRRTRVLLLGVPLLVGLTPQETVALIGHELGHFRWADSRRRLLTQPARTFFGVLATATRPPHGDAHDRELAGVHALFYTLWQVVGGAVSWLLFVVHLAMNTLDAREGRRAEVRADAMASSAAGSTAALSMIDVLVLSPVLAPLVTAYGTPGGAMDVWRRAIATTRTQRAGQLPMLRQLTIREHASLLASHPAPGRRHQVISQLPYRDASVVVAPDEAAVLDAELRPFVEALRKQLAQAYDL